MRRSGLCLVLAASLAAVLAAVPISTAFAAGGGGGGGMGMASPAPAPVDVNAEWRSGIDALNAQTWSKAIRHFRTVAGALPKNPDVLNLLGYSYRRNGDAKKALKYYQRALAIKPDHLGANEYLGELFLETQQVDKAEERLAVLRGCCADTPETQTLARAIETVKAGQAFAASPPRLSY